MRASRKKPSSIVTPARTKLAWIWTVAIILAVFFFLVLPGVLWLVSWRSGTVVTAGGSGCSLSHCISVGPIPINLTGGVRGITLHILQPGGCLDVYDRDMIWLGRDCAGKFVDLREKGATFYASTSTIPVLVTYDLL